MKNFKTSQILFALTLLILSGCFYNNDPDEKSLGQFSFSFLPSDQATPGGRKATDPVPTYVHFKAVKEDGTMITGKVELYVFEQSYVSQPQQFEVGHYTLQEFLVLDVDGQVIYAAPLAGSELAKLVEHPLPLNFEVNAGETSVVAPEVAPVEGYDPDDFGYVVWSLNLAVKKMEFKLPIDPSLWSKYEAASLTITQGSYTRSVAFTGSPESGVKATVAIKNNSPIDVSVAVNTNNVYQGTYPLHEYYPENVVSRSSRSVFQFNQNFASAPGNTIDLPAFKHRLGSGWDFKSAVLKANGENGSFIQVDFHKDGLCSDEIIVVSNASAFPFPSNVPVYHQTDKMIWHTFDPMYQQSSVMEGVGGYFYPTPNCENGICRQTGEWYTESLIKFTPACEANEWKFFDSFVRIQTEKDNVKNFLSVYFWLDKEGSSSSPSSGRRKSSERSEPLVLRPM